MENTSGIKSRFRSSEEWLDRSLKIIPSATQTFSKGHTQFPVGASPLFLERGHGSHVWDVDGNEYIDYPLALGANILGYGNPVVEAAMAQRCRDGASFSLPHRLEVEVAEMLIERIPCAEMVRFGKNGSDATSAAVRLARAATGRDHIAACGYHGWQDWYIGTTTRDRGVPQAVKDLTHTFQYNDMDSLERLFRELPGKIAAVIMEPIGIIEPRPGFLGEAAKCARGHGAVFILDEIVTGFRLSRGGAQEFYGVTPDIACFGKGMANGMPLSAVVGRRDLMELFDEIFYSFTAGGDTVSLAACRATLEEIDRLDVCAKIRETGEGLRDSLNALCARHGLSDRIVCLGYGAHTVVEFKNAAGEPDLALRTLFQQEVIAEGILFLVGHNICAALTAEDVARTLEAYERTLRTIRGACDAGGPEKALRGRVVQPVFRKP